MSVGCILSIISNKQIVNIVHQTHIYIYHCICISVFISNIRYIIIYIEDLFTLICSYKCFKEKFPLLIQNRKWNSGVLIVEVVRFYCIIF